MIELGSGTLTCEQIASIARDRAAVRLAPQVAARLAEGHRAVVALAAAGPVYGRSTGVGALLTARLLNGPMGPDPAGGLGSDDGGTDRDGPGEDGVGQERVGRAGVDPAGSGQQAAELSDGLLRSHATTAGPALPAEQIRAMTAVRIEQIAVGRSGLGPATVLALADLLNEDRMPSIGRYNSLGTGDIAPLARLALALPADALDAGDGLALMSSNALTLGRAALAVVDLDRLLAAATVVTALTFLARDGAPGALHELAAGPFPGPRRVARVLRRLGAGSRQPARLQDQYGLRAAPQTLGFAVDAGTTLREVVTALAAAGLENPLVIAGPSTSVVHHGGFHAVHLTAALDGAALGLARAAVGSVNRLALLTEPPPTGAAPSAGQPSAGQSSAGQPSAGWVPPDEARAFLAGGPATASGIMVLEYTAAAALGTVRAAAIPAATQTAGLSRGIEQDATYAPLAADQLAEAIAAARVLVAVELVAATRALRLRQLALPSPLAEVWLTCSTLPADMHDRDLTDDVRHAESLLDLIATAGEASGDDEANPSRPEDGLL